MKKKFLLVFCFSLLSLNIYAESSTQRQITLQANLDDTNKLDIVLISSDNIEKTESFLKDVANNAIEMNKIIRSDFEKLDSDLTPINPATFEFINEAINLSMITDGWFDITSPSEKTWFIKKDYRRIELIDNPPSARLKSSDMKFDLDLLLSAFIVDSVSDALIEKGYLNGLVSIGNVQKGFGEDLYTPWTISIPKEDVKDSKAYMAKHYGIRNAGWVILMNNTQIVDAKSKKAVIPWYINMTVLSTKATTAVAFAYTIASLGPKVGLEYIQTHNEIEAVVTTTNGEILASKAFKMASPFVFKELKGNHGPNNLSQKQKEEDAEIGK